MRSHTTLRLRYQRKYIPIDTTNRHQLSEKSIFFNSWVCSIKLFPKKYTIPPKKSTRNNHFPHFFHLSDSLIEKSLSIKILSSPHIAPIYNNWCFHACTHMFQINIRKFSPFG